MTKNKIIISICFLVFLSGVQGQNFKPRQIRQLQSFGFKNESLTKVEPEYKIRFNEILKEEKIRRRRKRAGFIYAIDGIAGAVLGLLMIESSYRSSNRNAKEGGLGEAFGIVFLVSGGTFMSLSIPYFIWSNKRKKKRDKLIWELKADLSKNHQQ